jgi:hypothetical protein
VIALSFSLQVRAARAWRAAVVVGVLALAAAMPAAATDSAATQIDEGQMKAAFLFNFAKFVQWPASQEGPLVIGVAGDEAFSTLVQRLIEGRTVNGRDVATRKLGRGDDPAGCHILFIASYLQRESTAMLQRTPRSVLTVGETAQFIRDGGMVRFYVDDHRLRFQIDQKNAEAAGLKVSSQLLTLAAR